MYSVLEKCDLQSFVLCPCSALQGNNSIRRVFDVVNSLLCKGLNVRLAYAV
ncbi:hypothetical protein M378DRAFT_165182, partial [Amanita muscaria Koide BX008]